MDNSKDLLLIENIVKIAAMNNLLIKKGLLSEEEMIEEMTKISKTLVDHSKTFVNQIKASAEENSDSVIKTSDI